MNDLKIFVNYLNNWSHNQITKISKWNVHRFKSFAEYCKLQYGSAVGIWYLSNLLYWTAWKSYLLLRTLCTCQFNDAPLYPFDSSISRNSMQIWRTPDHLCENDSPLSHFCDWHFGFLTHMYLIFILQWPTFDSPCRGCRGGSCNWQVHYSKEIEPIFFPTKWLCLPIWASLSE